MSICFRNIEPLSVFFVSNESKIFVSHFPKASVIYAWNGNHVNVPLIYRELSTVLD